MSPRIGPGGVSSGRGRGRLGSVRLVLRLLFMCALAAIVVWGGGGIFSGLEDQGGTGQGGQGQGQEEQSGREGAGGVSDGASSGAGGSGIPQCADGELSEEAREVADTISEGGEFQYPDKDGSTFGNREGLLPDESDDYYAEYTVPTPGEDDRGARRIVTGGDTTPTTPDTHPEHWYWTDDHYESFCEFTA
ncbi:guanyl-specific ribonuclease [Kytococcus sp. Marseille-QA3725]